MCSVALLGALDALKGDAAVMAQRWSSPIAPLQPQSIAARRPHHRRAVRRRAGAAARRRRRRRRSRRSTPPAVPVLAVDVPSGLDGTTGAGARARSSRRCAPSRSSAASPGICCMPGRALCGAVDRGRHRHSTPACWPRSAPSTWTNAPGLWRAHLPWPEPRRPQIRSRPRRRRVRARRHTRARRASAPAARCASAPAWSRSPARPTRIAVNAAHLTAIMLLRLRRSGRARRHSRRQAQERGAARPGAGRRRADTAARARRARIRRRDACSTPTPSPRSPAHASELVRRHRRRCWPPRGADAARGRVRPPVRRRAAGSKLERARAAAARSAPSSC